MKKPETKPETKPDMSQWNPEHPNWVEVGGKIPKSANGKARADAAKGRDVYYPNVVTKVCRFLPDSSLYNDYSRPPLTAEKAKSLLKWEDEDEYKIRMKLTEVDDPYQGDYLLKDENGRKVRCWDNIGNRPLDMQWVKHLTQDILNRRWRFNGEALVIGRTGIVMSGQHRLIALVLAWQIWSKRGEHTEWRHLWPDEPYIETVVTFGTDETQDVKGTLDEVKARTVADSLYTSNLFPGKVGKERKDLCRYTDHAVTLLWQRTGAGDTSMLEKIQTHSSSMGFLERHPKVQRCVEHVHADNADMGITSLRLYCGHAAAMMYLMASDKSDGDAYRNFDPAPHEKKLDFGDWDTAAAFWDDMARKEKTKVSPVRQALGNLIDPEEGGSGRPVEKIGIVAKAWPLYRDGAPITVDDVTLATKVNDGVRELLEFPEFGGIDLGPGVKGKGDQADPPADPAQTEAEKERIRRENAEAAEKVAKGGNNEPTLSDEELLKRRKEQAAKLMANRKATGGKPAPVKAPLPGGAAKKSASNGKAAKKPAKAAAGK